MARIELNPIITSAHGRLGNLVFYYRNGIEYARTCVKGRDPDTEAQKLVRRSFGDAVRSWQAMTEDEKHKFNRKAAYMNMSGYNLYISGYMKKRISALPAPSLKTGHSYKLCSSGNQSQPASVSPPFIRASIDNVPVTRSQDRPG